MSTWASNYTTAGCRRGLATARQRDVGDQEVVVLVLVSGVLGLEGAEGEIDVVDIEHPGGRILVPSGRCHR
jgi:hypothetical protein